MATCNKNVMVGYERAISGYFPSLSSRVDNDFDVVGQHYIRLQLQVGSACLQFQVKPVSVCHVRLIQVGIDNTSRYKTLQRYTTPDRIRQYMQDLKKEAKKVYNV